MIRTLSAALLLAASAAFAADEKAPAKADSPTDNDAAKGWIHLFDGETTFGWKVDGPVKVESGELIIGGAERATAESTSAFADATVSFTYEVAEGKNASVTVFGRNWQLGGKGTSSFTAEGDKVEVVDFGKVIAKFDYARGPDRRPTTLKFEVPPGGKLRLKTASVFPRGFKPLFNGKDLAGWKEFPGKKSKWAVDEKGELTVKDGPGDLQTEGQWADFIFQIEAFSHGKALNSGVFFRCIAGEYQNGYEAQIQNGYKDNDRTKPADFGTGAIYRRIAARKVVSNDNEWFTMTVLAHGNHIATWVNGYQTVDWTDERAPDNNPRKGFKAGKGHISLQGHDPTTNLSFRNIRIAELPAPEAK